MHEKHGLLGAKFTAGHGVWLSNDEFRRFSEAAQPLRFCPLSNLFLGSGLFRLGRAMDPDQRVRVCLGCDMGGGNAFSMVRVFEEAYKVGMCNNTMLDGSVDPREQDSAEAERNKLSPYRAFYLATLGGARALYLDDVLGNFNKGKEADFVGIDWNAGQLAMAWHQSLTVEDGNIETMEQAAKLLFGIMSVGDDRNIDETWIAGKREYQEPAWQGHCRMPGSPWRHHHGGGALARGQSALWASSQSRLTVNPHAPFCRSARLVPVHCPCYDRRYCVHATLTSNCGIVT